MTVIYTYQDKDYQDKSDIACHSWRISCVVKLHFSSSKVGQT